MNRHSFPGSAFAACARRTAATWGAVVLFVVLILILTSPAVAGIIETIDGVAHVRNPAQPPGGTEILQLEEMWRAGGEDGEELFGVVIQVRHDDEGNIYLLDTQLSQVHVYSADGEFLGPLSREGEGPGETRRPGDLVLLESGEVGLVQTFPGRVVLVDRQDNPAGDVDVGGNDPTQGGFCMIRTGQCRGGNMVFGATFIEQGDQPGRQTRHAEVVAFDRDGTKGHVYHRFTYELSFQDAEFSERKTMDWALRRFDVGPGGRVFSATERDAYRVEVFAPDGRLERVIEREYSQRKRTPDERKMLNNLFEAATRQIPIPIEIILEDTEPPILWLSNGIRVADDGSLWVASEEGVRDQPEGIMQTFDVFDTEGHFSRQVSVALDGDPDQDVLFFFGEDRVALVSGFMDAIKAMFGGVEGEEDDEEPEPMEIICYRIAG